jgi:acetyl-CoA carboxylase biotin carboxylase subunit
MRADIRAAAVRYGERLSYRGAGTVEFLVDVERGDFFFLEMNARIQVEHPVTEMVTGIDLVAEQIRIAEGRGLSLAQEDVRLSGCAIECRINAEDPAQGFMPSPGRITEATWPGGEGVRVDTHITTGAMVPPFYDSLLAKLIAHGPDRPTALARLAGAIDGARVIGVHTNLGFHAMVLADPEFAAGGVDTSYLVRLLERRPSPAEA